MEGIEWFFSESLGWTSRKIVEEHKAETHKNYKKFNEQKAMVMFEEFLSSIMAK
jgi:hypothetical protein